MDGNSACTLNTEKPTEKIIIIIIIIIILYVWCYKLQTQSQTLLKYLDRC